LSERSDSRADDPFGGRRPTSHERMTGLPWDASYRDGPAPWDIGRPQPAVARVAAEGGFVGAVLDAGCGSGENALHLGSLRLSVVGVDVAETALAIARETAGDRGIDVEFAACDAFQLQRLGLVFNTGIPDEPGSGHRARRDALRVVFQRRRSRSGATSHQPGRAARRVPRWLERRRYRTGPDPHALSR
jgi:SAM-dependent methyltransferase